MFQEEKIYIGIDVSKAVLDIFILPTRKYMQFKNTETDIQKLIKKIALFSNVLVVLESTGGYEKPLTYALSETKADVCVMNPRQIRGGRAAVRKALYMPTLVAIKYNLQIRTFYRPRY
ncbi:IS110 family transposase [Legionella lansingensis]|uniref:IS110 family transposase n=1 Tax=Legionella lansingensis TaxID=45067 RepID=UPI00048DFB07|nr:IS110 family transposase [Legionella lansingensis]